MEAPPWLSACGLGFQVGKRRLRKAKQGPEVAGGPEAVLCRDSPHGALETPWDAMLPSEAGFWKGQAGGRQGLKAQA